MHDNIKILFATDFSKSSRAALHTAQLLTKVYEADVSLVHVLSNFWKNFVSSGLKEKEALQRLATWQERINPKNKSENRLHVHLGNAADRILQQADIEDPELLLLGGESVRSKDTFLTGTTAEAVVRHAKHSVWLVKKEVISKVICGIDGSQASAKAMHEAIGICQRFLAELCIVYAIPQANFNPMGMTDEQVNEAEETFKKDRTEKIECFLEQFDLASIKCRKYFSWGIPAHLILDLAEDFDYELIVIGATGQSILKQVVMGSTAEKILRHTPCSLLIVR